MNQLFTDEQWLAWIDELSDNDIVTIDNFLPTELWQTLRDFLVQKDNENDLKKAALGTGGNKQIVEEIRGDYTFWIEETRDTELERFFGLIHELKTMLNRYCYLSLSGHEFHLAHYPVGSFYKRHLDQFNSRSNRMITLIIYLNEDWKEGNGGELKVYQENEKLIAPLKNRCVLFKSADVPHEVLKTHTSRYSLTGWFLYQPPGIGFLS